MKTTIVMAITGVCVFTGCSALPALLGAVFEPAPEKGWAQKAQFERLMQHSSRVLLSEDEKVRAAKNICALKHLDKNIKNDIFLKKSKKFCKLEKNDKIYFYDKCMECGNLIDTIGTSYLLVRDNKPIEMAEIERQWNDELYRTVFIIERLH
jgi:hypothetical protein